MAKWIEEAGFSQVVLLASVDSARRIHQNQFFSNGIVSRYWGTMWEGEKVPEALGPLAADPTWAPLEEGSFDLCFKKESYTAALVAACRQRTIPLTLLTVFCGEGLNIPHAIHIAHAVVRLHLSEEKDSVEEVKLRVPPVWIELLDERSPAEEVLYG
jgi:hypothetical protein